MNKARMIERLLTIQPHPIYNGNVVQFSILMEDSDVPLFFEMEKRDSLELGESIVQYWKVIDNFEKRFPIDKPLDREDVRRWRERIESLNLSDRLKALIEMLYKTVAILEE
jgi:hypothetical protein